MYKQGYVIKGGNLERILAKLEGFRVFAENSALGVAVSDLKGRLKYVNSALAELLGYSIQEMVDLPFKDFLHPADRWKVMRLFLRIIALKRQPGYLEFRAVRKDGGVIYLWSKPSRFMVDGNTVGFQAILVDVTRLRETERKLTETNRKLEMILKTAMEGIIIADPDDNLTFVNEAFANIVGYKEKELLRLNLRKLVGAEGFQKIRRETEIRKKGRVSRYELVLRRKDGKPRVVQVSASPLWNENGNYVGTIAIVMDIMEQKKMEEKIKESEERLRKLVEYAPDTIYINDLNGNFIDGNRRAEILTGYRREELIGKNMLEIGLLPKKYLQKAAEALQKNMRGEKTGPDEFELIKKDGTSVIVEISTFPVTRGDSVEVIGIARDITDRKRIEEALKESETKYRTIFESANDSLILLDASGRIVNVNKKAEEVFGGSKEELLGKHFTEVNVVSQEDLPKLLESFSRILDGKEGYLSLTITNKQGQERHLECSSSIIRTNDTLSGILIIARDVTERNYMQKKLEEYSQQLENLVEERTKQLREAQEQLLKSERLAAIGQVAAMVGHDLRNPLASISGATYYLKRKLDKKLDEKAREMLEIIERDIQYSNKIINDLVEYSREIKLELTETTPKAMMKNGLALVEIPRNVEVLDLTQDKPKIKADVDKMRRVFANFIKNAVEAMPDGGKLTILSRKSDGNVQFMFIDTGVGMVKEVMEKIWTPFFTTKAKGMGLGLPICRRIIEAHGGKISVESIVGEGTTFTVTMPIEPKPRKEGGENRVWVNLPESLLSTTTKA
ncbi:MAG: PAS domain S-box protein [Candidatus Bathycorpusculaceae bacterium]